MRIIAGQFRSRKLKPVPGMITRPTPDRLRETLFNILAPRIGDKHFVDAYAGTGAVGIEALSRGARHITFIEKRPEALEILRENLQTLHIANEATVLRGSALRLLATVTADIVFLDPPYDQLSDYKSCFEAMADKTVELVIAQHTSRYNLAERYGPLGKIRVLKQGDNSLSFFELSR